MLLERPGARLDTLFGPGSHVYGVAGRMFVLLDGATPMREGRKFGRRVR